ncbi:MAG: Cj0069 family protein, partial [Alphaproteobacteria bacterium]|nr:Cj0069 family protein [Alphaproteobacteria bacterium]
AWVDPLDNGRDRSDLDRILRDAAANGVWIGSHPDVIAKIGTKEVLFETRHLGWGTDIARYRDADTFRREFPARLKADGCRVLKRVRGNGGQGVFCVTRLSADKVRLQVATDRDETARDEDLAAFLTTCGDYLNRGGLLIDQAFQPRISEGMVRCYLSGGELVGFARQYPMEGAKADRIFGLPAGKTMLPPDKPALQNLRRNLEREWVPQMCAHFALSEAELPAIWDCDFLFGAGDSFVLCEINASCITPFPPQAPAKIAARAAKALSAE